MVASLIQGLSPEQLRWLANELVTLRRWMISAKLAELRGRPHRAQVIMRGLDDRVSRWPARLQLLDLRKYVLRPTQNKINREGILAQAEAE